MGFKNLDPTPPYINNKKIVLAKKDYIYLDKEVNIQNKSYFLILVIVTLLVFSMTFNHFGYSILIFLIGFFVEFLVLGLIIILLDITPDLNKEYIYVNKELFNGFEEYDEIVGFENNMKINFLIVSKLRDSNKDEYRFELIKLEDIANNHQEIQDAIIKINDYRKKVFMWFFSIIFILAVTIHLTIGQEKSIFF